MAEEGSGRGPPVSAADAAYTAGLLDGEGHIGIREWEGTCGSNYGLGVFIYNTDLPIMVWLQTVFGGRFSQRTRRDDRTGRQYRVNYHWYLYGQPAADFLRLVAPFAKIKRRHIEAALTYQEMWSYGPHGAVPKAEAQREIGEEYRALLSRLNQGKEGG